jgi:hypothetical protein
VLRNDYAIDSTHEFEKEFWMGILDASFEDLRNI